MDGLALTVGGAILTACTALCLADLLWKRYRSYCCNRRSNDANAHGMIYRGDASSAVYPNLTAVVLERLPPYKANTASYL